MNVYEGVESDPRTNGQIVVTIWTQGSWSLMRMTGPKIVCFSTQNVQWEIASV